MGLKLSLLMMGQPIKPLIYAMSWHKCIHRLKLFTRKIKDRLKRAKSVSPSVILYQKAVETEADMVIYQAFLEEGERIYPLRTFFISEDEINKDPIFCFLNAQLAPAVWTKFIKRAYLNETKLNFPTLSYSEDVVITLRLLLASPKITLLDEPLYYYYQRASSLVHVVNEHCLEIFESLALVKSDLILKGLYDQYNKQYLHFSELHLAPVRQKVKRNLLLKEKFDQLYESWKNDNGEE